MKYFNLYFIYRNRTSNNNSAHCNMLDEVPEPETFGPSISLFEYKMGDIEEWPTPLESLDYTNRRERQHRRRIWRRGCGKGGLTR